MPDVVTVVVVSPVVSSPVPRTKYRAGDLVSLCVEDTNCALGIKYDQEVILRVRPAHMPGFYFPYLRSTIYNH